MSQLVKKVIVNSKKDFNKEELPMIEIIDAPCGRGKTSYAINKINNSEDKVVYVTPFLSEVDRMTKECKRLCSPDTKESDTKVEDFVRLLKEGKSIATTHSLFKGFNDDCYRLIKENGYSLIFDEVITTVKTYGITVDEFRMCLYNVIPGIGEATCNTITNEFNFFEKDILFIINNINIFNSYGTNNPNAKQIRFTGFRNQQLSEQLITLGYDADCNASVTKKTDILLH